jgi:hypothetical protein
MGMDRGQGGDASIYQGGAQICACQADIAEDVVVELEHFGIHSTLAGTVEHGREKAGHFSLSFRGG